MMECHPTIQELFLKTYQFLGLWGNGVNGDSGPPAFRSAVIPYAGSSHCSSRWTAVLRLLPHRTTLLCPTHVCATHTKQPLGKSLLTVRMPKYLKKYIYYGPVNTSYLRYTVQHNTFPPLWGLEYLIWRHVWWKPQNVDHPGSARLLCHLGQVT